MKGSPTTLFLICHTEFCRESQPSEGLTSLSLILPKVIAIAFFYPITEIDDEKDSEREMSTSIHTPTAITVKTMSASLKI